MIEWIADFTQQDTRSAGFGRVDLQRQDQQPHEVHDIALSIVDTTSLVGLERAVQLGIGPSEKRFEVLPASVELRDGTEHWFRVDFAFGHDFDFAPVWGPLISQIHQNTANGSPPIEFQTRRRTSTGDNELLLSGGDTTYNPPREDGHRLARPIGAPSSRPALSLQWNTVYKLVFGVKFSILPNKSLIDVWVNDEQYLSKFPLAWKTVMPDADTSRQYSYWKGATFYTGPGMGGTMWQANHRVGSSFASVD